MRALSLSQPWCYAMTSAPPHLRKLVENRRRPLPLCMYDQWFALHAAKSWDDEPRSALGGLTPCQFIRSKGIELPADRAGFVAGAVVGYARLIGQVTSTAELVAEELDQRAWFFGPYGYLLRDDVFVLPRPVRARGRLGFWHLDADVAAAVTSQLPALAA